MKKILIVDDEEDILQFLSYYFVKNDFLVTTAIDGNHGLSCALNTKFDLIISDIRMPNMDGITMCNTLRNNGVTTPFIFLTAVTDDYKIIHAMKSGANQIVDKPVKLEYLKFIVEETLK